MQRTSRGQVAAEWMGFFFLRPFFDMGQFIDAEKFVYK